MKIKMTLTKAEKIMALLNQWNLAGEYKSSRDYRVYSFEAETIADSIRTNSSVASVEKAVREAMEVIMEGKAFINNELHQMAGCILAAIKR